MTRAPTDATNRLAAAHRFWTRWLIVVCGLLAVQGVSWMVFGSFDPWGLYDDWLARSLLGSAALPAEALPTLRFAIGLLGATDAAFFVLLAFVVWNAYRPGAPGPGGPSPPRSSSGFYSTRSFRCWPEPPSMSGWSTCRACC